MNFLLNDLVSTLCIFIVTVELLTLGLYLFYQALKKALLKSINSVVEDTRPQRPQIYINSCKNKTVHARTSKPGVYRAKFTSNYIPVNDQNW